MDAGYDNDTSNGIDDDNDDDDNDDDDGDDDDEDKNDDDHDDDHVHGGAEQNTKKEICGNWTYVTETNWDSHRHSCKWSRRKCKRSRRRRWTRLRFWLLAGCGLNHQRSLKYNY